MVARGREGEATNTIYSHVSSCKTRPVEDVLVARFNFRDKAFGVPGRLHLETAQCLNLEVAKIFCECGFNKGSA